MIKRFRITYVKSTPAVGRELNLERCDGVLKIHNDVKTLLDIHNKVIDVNRANAFLARMQQQPISPGDAPTGSRFAPWLSDKLEAARNEFAELNAAEKKVERERKISEYNSKLSELKKSLGLD